MASVDSTNTDCCADLTTAKNAAADGGNPDHSEQIKRLNRVVGQLQGVKRMIEENRYCPDILMQTRAAASALKAVELLILETHLRHCVSQALSAPSARDADRKVEELIQVVSRF
jgi:DNA-binding FrmR family transcriptional regulator